MSDQDDSNAYDGDPSSDEPYDGEFVAEEPYEEEEEEGAYEGEGVPTIGTNAYRPEFDSDGDGAAKNNEIDDYEDDVDDVGEAADDPNDEDFDPVKGGKDVSGSDDDGSNAYEDNLSDEDYVAEGRRATKRRLPAKKTGQKGGRKQAQRHRNAWSEDDDEDDQEDINEVEDDDGGAKGDGDGDWMPGRGGDAKDGEQTEAWAQPRGSGKSRTGGGPKWFQEGGYYGEGVKTMGAGSSRRSGSAKSGAGSSRRRKARQRPSSGSEDAGANNRETRTSARVPRKSYVEFLDDQSDDEERVKKRPKQAAFEEEEEDTDAIERVLWHQPLGSAAAAEAQALSTQPEVAYFDPDVDLSWDHQEFYIKWKGMSYIRCSWVPLSELQVLSGHKKVFNYMKKVEEEIRLRRRLSPEEAEALDVTREMDLDLLKQHCQVERIFADRRQLVDGVDVQEYLVKWKGLSYEEATWEKDVLLAFAQDSIDEYKTREANMQKVGKTVESQRGERHEAENCPKIEQPEWLKAGNLRDYQIDGLNFLILSWLRNRNVVLADEMGLGKTVQSVSMLGFLQYDRDVQGPFLVVVPLSTLTNWAKEFRKWLPEMNVVLYVGSRASREVAQKYEFFHQSLKGRKAKFNALLTTYEVVLKDKAVLSKFTWAYMMVDEAHRLKNSDAALYAALLEFNAKNKLLITGTPLQNSVEELWALLHFLEPAKFGRREDFLEKYNALQDEQEISALHQELRPHMLRRVIKDVEKSLPPKIERILRVEMSPLQRQYYKWILERNFSDLNKGVRGTNQVSLLNVVMELKKCCNHPFLFDSADYDYGGGKEEDNGHVNRIRRLILSSGKLTLLDRLLTRLKETNHRVLIFSQMVRMLDLLADYLRLKGYQYQRLDGSTRADLRHQAMEHFNAPGSEDFCFLLSTRAGGLGINLATADTVIIFDSDWNPQNDLQAMSRAHRIGQQDVVNIYRFVTSKSVEEDILERAKKKMVLDHLVIQKLNAAGRLEQQKTRGKGTTMFDKNELAAILRFGAEELFKNGEKENGGGGGEKDDKGAARLENLDIDEILDRAEKVDQSQATGGAGEEFLGAFKVASFSTNEDDATFWSRLISHDAVTQAQDALMPRTARKKTATNYREEDDLAAKKGGHWEEGEGSKKRSRTATKGGIKGGAARMSGPAAAKSKAGRSRGKGGADVAAPAPLEGASARIASWQGREGGISKREASEFIRAVKRYGDLSRLDLIAGEVGGVIAAASAGAVEDLWHTLMDGCREADRKGGKPGADKAGAKGDKGATLDFYGVSVKPVELLSRVRELTQLGKRVEQYKDPVTQFRLKSHPKPPAWAKACQWTQVDDARLLLGVRWHGFGNWEKIRLDERLHLSKKIAPPGATAGDTNLPRGQQLEVRANNLLHKELEMDSGKKHSSGVGTGQGAWSPRGGGEEEGKKGAGMKRARSSVVPARFSGGDGRNGGIWEREKDRDRDRDRHKKRRKMESAVKEEGEISDDGDGDEDSPRQQQDWRKRGAYTADGWARSGKDKGDRREREGGGGGGGGSKRKGGEGMRHHGPRDGRGGGEDEHHHHHGHGHHHHHQRSGGQPSALKKEERWVTWCRDELSDTKKTLDAFRRFQKHSHELPKEKALETVRAYLRTLGGKIDNIMDEHDSSATKKETMETRLWEYVVNFTGSAFTGSRLAFLYRQMKENAGARDSREEPKRGGGPSEGPGEERSAAAGCNAGGRGKEFERRERERSDGWAAEGREDRKDWGRQQQERGKERQSWYSGEQDKWEHGDTGGEDGLREEEEPEDKARASHGGSGRRTDLGPKGMRPPSRGFPEDEDELNRGGEGSEGDWRQRGGGGEEGGGGGKEGVRAKEVTRSVVLEDKEKVRGGGRGVLHGGGGLRPGSAEVWEINVGRGGKGGKAVNGTSDGNNNIKGFIGGRRTQGRRSKGGWVGR